VLYLAYCCFLVPALRLCFSRLRIRVRLGVSALRLVLFHVVGLLMSCFRLFGIPHSVLAVLGQKPPVRLGVSALRLLLFHVVGLLMSCFRLFGIPHSVLVVLGQKPPGVLRSLPIFPCFLGNPGCLPCL